MGWISVDYRLPPQDEPVLINIYDHREKIKMSFVHIGYRFNKNWYYQTDNGEGELVNAKYGHVTHWMPLPDSPAIIKSGLLEDSFTRHCKAVLHFIEERGGEARRQEITTSKRIKGNDSLKIKANSKTYDEVLEHLIDIGQIIEIPAKLKNDQIYKIITETNLL